MEESAREKQQDWEGRRFALPEGAASAAAEKASKLLRNLMMYGL